MGNKPEQGGNMMKNGIDHGNHLEQKDERENKRLQKRLQKAVNAEKVPDYLRDRISKMIPEK